MHESTAPRNQNHISSEVIVVLKQRRDSNKSPMQTVLGTTGGKLNDETHGKRDEAEV